MIRCGTEGRETAQLRKNSPWQTNRAGPRKKTLPPSAHGLRAAGRVHFDGRIGPSRAMAATADAQDPVPEDVVSPTPRSKKRNGFTSCLLPKTTYSTFTPSGNSASAGFWPPAIANRRKLGDKDRHNADCPSRRGCRALYDLQFSS